MIDIILIALASNWLLFNPVYQTILRLARLDFAPLNCLYCISFYIAFGIIHVVKGVNITDALIASTAASFLAVVIERVFNSFPVRIK